MKPLNQLDQKSLELLFQDKFVLLLFEESSPGFLKGYGHPTDEQ
jgi:hypothetical protein